MERVRFADDIPVAYEITSIPEKIIRGFKESEITEHFFKTLTDNGYEIGKVSRQYQQVWLIVV